MYSKSFILKENDIRNLLIYHYIWVTAQIV